jgi:putative zinc finger/helix-turn-helix YgiT family protein
MTVLCINCAQDNLETTRVRLSGEIRKFPYTVEMEGLKCPACGYSTVDSRSMAEFGRLASDEYRRAHGLLTSTEIRNIRTNLGLSQQEFADFIDVGIASIKRWELGKIQDKRSDDLIREKTKPTISNVAQYAMPSPVSTSGTSLCYRQVGSGSTPHSVVTTVQFAYFYNNGLGVGIANSSCALSSNTADSQDFEIIPSPLNDRSVISNFRISARV